MAIKPQHTPAKPRVIVAMSGGVDSSVAALLLHEQGYDIIGITMRLSSEPAEQIANPKGCCSAQDVEDARRVCQALGKPHYFINMEAEFKTHVIDYFVSEYQEGRTPHPCIACNDRMKFDFLMKRAEFMEADFVATGHYARIRQNRETENFELLKGVDANKDQSYVLYGLNQAQLSRILLPVGEHSKQQIRAFASEANLSVAGKKDSQEICFIPQGDYREFMRHKVTPQRGSLIDKHGAYLGEHPGIEFFTVGQRRGIGLTNTKGPLYVTKVNPKTKEVTVGCEDDLYHPGVTINKINYVSGIAPLDPIRVTAKIRYTGDTLQGTLNPSGTSAIFRFDAPQRAATPGQAAVFYDGDSVIGGGVIEQPLPTT